MYTRKKKYRYRNHNFAGAEFPNGCKFGRIIQKDPNKWSGLSSLRQNFIQISMANKGQTYQNYVLYSYFWIYRMLRPLASKIGFRQRVVKVYFPPTSDMTWQTQRLQNSAKQRVITFFFMMVYSIAAIGYRQECTNHDEHDKHGSGEPVNKALWHYTTSYIKCLWCDITGPWNNTQFTLLSFASISFQKPTGYLPNLLATIPRQIDVPEGLAKITRQNNLPQQLAEPKCGSNPRFLLARNKCDFSSR
jgi:hypothetical protein